MNTMTTLAARMAALADQLDAEAEPHGNGWPEGVRYAAAAIRAELAAAGPQTVWAVAATEYEDQATVAVLATEELADAFCDTLDKAHEIIEHRVHNHVPAEITLNLRSAYVLADGTVVRGSRYSQAHWDCERPEPVTVTGHTGRDLIEVHMPTGAEADRAVFAEVERRLMANSARDGRTPEWFAESLAGARRVLLEPEPKPIGSSACYDASFGRVHVRSSCRCPR